ncbi:MAG: hypothetical protein ABI947_29975 [Chloroflexota bacterium]
MSLFTRHAALLKLRLFMASLLIAIGLILFITSHNSVQAQSGSRWTPVDHRGQDEYWGQRLKGVTPQMLVAARAKAATFPQASQLPASNRVSAASPSGPSINQPPANTAWHLIGPSPISAGGGNNYAGRIASLAVDTTTTGVVYAGTAGGGVWKTTNNGTLWSPVTDFQASLAIGAIAIDPNNHNIVYAGTGEPNQSGDSYYGAGILKSTNAGATWTLYGTATFGSRTNAISKVIVDPHNSTHVFAASRHGLYASTDSGATWALVGGGLPGSGTTKADDLGIDATTTPSTLYVTMRFSGMYKSTDGGATWNLLTTGLPVAGNWDRSVLAVAPSNPSVVYVVITHGSGGDVYVNGSYNGGYYTTNGGTNWSPMLSLNQNFTDGGFGGQGWYDVALIVDPLNDDIVYGGGVDVANTLDARAASGNWRNITSVYSFDNSNIHPDQHAFAFAACNAAPCGLYVGNDGGIYFSNNTTNPIATSVVYSNLNTAGLAITEFTGGDLGPNFVNNRLALGGTQDNGTMRYDKAPIWPLVWGGDGGFAVINQVHPQIMYTENFGVSLRKSTNGGTSWGDGTAGGQIADLAGDSEFYMPYVLDRANENHLIAGTDAVYETTNATTSWYQSSQTFGGVRVSAVAVAPANSAVIYGGLENGTVFKTTQGNSGTQHTYIQTANTFSGQYITSIAVDPGDSTGNTAFVTTGNFFSGNAGHIWKTTNGGASAWTDISGTLPSYPINSVVVYYSGGTRVLVIGTDYGVYFTTNDGGTWTALNVGLPNAVVGQLALDAQRSTLAAFTHGRSVWTIAIPESTGGTGDTVGVFRPSATTFYLRNSLSSGFADITTPFGVATDLPIAGDWDGDGISTIGVFRPSTATFYLKNSNASAAPVAYTFVLGVPNDTPIAGDWNGDGIDGVGIFRPSNGLIYLKNTLTTGFADYQMVLGVPGDTGVAGDWNGDGVDSPGIFRPSSVTFYLSNKVCNCSVFADYSATLGIANDLPIAGDWTHVGKSGIGVFRPSNGLIYLKNVIATGFADFNFTLGVANDKPVAGHWNTVAPTIANQSGSTAPAVKVAPTFVP